MLSADTHAHLAAHLTARDVWLLHMLWEHRVLTSHHIADLAFTTDRKARRRRRHPHDLGLLDRFRPRLQVGSAPWHYVLGAAGAAVLAAQAGTTARALRYRRDTTIAIAFHHTLAHTTAINTFFAALAHASTHPPRGGGPGDSQARAGLDDPSGSPQISPGSTTQAHRVAAARPIRQRLPRLRLQVWWSENRCRRHLDIDARPDAFGRITVHTPPPRARPPRDHQPGTLRDRDRRQTLDHLPLDHPTLDNRTLDDSTLDDRHEVGDRDSGDRAQRTGRRGRVWAFEWFLEIDLGTESLGRLAAKIDRYADLAAATHTATPLLVLLPNRDLAEP